MPHKLYEGMFLFDANLAGRDWPGLEQHVHDLLKRSNAELVYSERWPDRKLAYEIKGCKKGTYYLTYFKAPPSAIQGLTRDCQLSDRILRLLVLYDDALVEDCQKRINRELQGPPEEIEEQRERGRVAAKSASDDERSDGGDSDGGDSDGGDSDDGDSDDGDGGDDDNDGDSEEEERDDRADRD